MYSQFDREIAEFLEGGWEATFMIVALSVTIETKNLASQKVSAAYVFINNDNMNNEIQAIILEIYVAIFVPFWPYCNQLHLY